MASVHHALSTCVRIDITYNTTVTRNAFYITIEFFPRLEPLTLNSSASLHKTHVCNHPKRPRAFVLYVLSCALPCLLLFLLFKGQRFGRSTLYALGRILPKPQGRALLWGDATHSPMHLSDLVRLPMRNSHIEHIGHVSGMSMNFL